MYIDFLKDFISLFAIVNPISGGVVMLGLLETSNQPIAAVARKTTLTVGIGMVVIYFLGRYLLEGFGIEVSAIQTIGGVVLFLMALGMVQGKDKAVNHSPSEKDSATRQDEIAIVPLGIPVLMGPGLIAVLLTTRPTLEGWQREATFGLAMFAVVLVTYFTLRFMPLLKKGLRSNGLRILSRIMGLVVGALAVQLIVGGVKQLWQ